MVLFTFKRGKKKCICLNGFSKNTERRRASIYLEYDYQSLFGVNPKISILLKTWVLKTYYLSNSFLKSQARKCSCSHSLRLYMFRCLDTGLDHSHQCLKKKERTMSPFTTWDIHIYTERIIIQDSLVASI